MWNSIVSIPDHCLFVYFPISVWQSWYMYGHLDGFRLASEATRQSYMVGLSTGRGHDLQVEN